MSGELRPSIGYVAALAAIAVRELIGAWWRALTGRGCGHGDLSET